MVLARCVPGIRAARTYEKAGHRRPDLVAGLVLAAILVPQGMAYAELAGLPAGHRAYTTIACLVGYAIFGPSRVLVLGPDSSVSPLIFAAIAPLLVDRRSRAARSRSPACWRCSSGSIEIGLGLGKLGFVADLLSSEVQVGYMNGLAITIIVGQLPEAVRLLDRRRRRSSTRSARSSSTSTRRRRRRCSSASACSSSCSCCRAITPKVPAVLVAVVGATIVSAVLGLAERRRRRPSGSLPEGFPTPTLPWTSAQRRRAAAARRGRHHARVAHRHHRDRVELRGPARRRGRTRTRR